MAGGKFWAGNTKAAKLTPADVINMRADYRDGITQGALARKYRMGIAQVGRIVRGEVWQDVYEEPKGEMDFALMERRLLETQKEVKSASERMQEAIREHKEKETRGDRMLDELTQGDQNDKGS